MTSVNYSDTIVNIMLGWLKGFAGWVLKLFNLAGTSGGSPLHWLSDNWLRLLVVLAAISIALDILVWLIRWRPYWVWFGKKRVIINDNNFFAAEKLPDEVREDDELFGDQLWDAGEKRSAPGAGGQEDELSFVDRERVGAPAVKARAENPYQDGDLFSVSAARKPQPTPAAKPNVEIYEPIAPTRSPRPEAEARSTDARKAEARAESAPRRSVAPDPRRDDGRRAEPRQKRPAKPKTPSPDELDRLFQVDEAKEDEVFNVSNLPAPKKGFGPIRRTGGAR